MKKSVLTLIIIISFSFLLVKAELKPYSHSCKEALDYMRSSAVEQTCQSYISFLLENKDKFDFNNESDHWMFNWLLSGSYYQTKNYKEALKYLPFVNDFIFKNAGILFDQNSSNQLESFYWEVNSLRNTGAETQRILDVLEKAKLAYEKCGLAETDVYKETLKNIEYFKGVSFEVVRMTPVIMENISLGNYEEAANQLESFLPDLLSSRTVYEYAGFLQLLGGCYGELGRESEQEAIYLDALKRMEDASAYELDAYRNIAYALAGLYIQMNNYQQASSYCMLSKILHERNLDFDSSYAQCLWLLAIIAEEEGNYYFAKLYLDVALKYMRDGAGSLTVEKGISFLETSYNLADFSIDKNTFSTHMNRLSQIAPLIEMLTRAYYIYQKAGFPEESKSVLDEAIALSEEYDLQNVQILVALGDMCLYQKNFPEALSFYEQAISINNFSFSNPILLMSKLLALWFMNNEPSLEVLLETSQAYRNNIKDSFNFLSETERAKFWKGIEKEMHFINMLVYNVSSPEDRLGVLYDNLLIIKGLLLRSSQDVRNAILATGSPEQIEEFNKLLNLRQQLTIEHDSDKRNNLMRDIENIDKRLSRIAQSYYELEQRINISWRDIQTELKENDIAIEFSLLADIDPSLIDKIEIDNVRYIASVIKKTILVLELSPYALMSSLILLIAGICIIPPNYMAWSGNLLNRNWKESKIYIFHPRESSIR